MKRAMKFSTLLAMGLLVAAPLATAQNAPFGLGTGNCASASDATKGGQLSVGVLGASDVGSSKFTEYREVPEGVSVPCFNLFSNDGKLEFKLFGYNVSQDDQRYQGWFNTSAFDLSFDYNQIPHDMGNGGRTMMAELSRGVWGMSDTLQQSLGTAVNATPTTGRTVTFYDALLGPTFASAGSVEISSMRKRGTATFDLGKKLPFDLSFSYMRELKDGYRGEDGGGIYSAVASVVELPGPLDEITQDIGVRAAYNFKKGNVHASFARNLYNNRAETLTVDNPFQWFDTPYVTTPAPAVGGGARARWINAPDNEASTGNLGFLLKLAKQTRIGGDVSMGRWTQNAPFYPYTINTAILTPAGARADALSTLPQSSFDGKIDTTTINLTFSSRPLENLAIRAQFRSYELENKTNRFVITGDVAASPDRSWSVVTPSAADPYGHATANVYDNKTTRFTGSASYDIGDLTLEGLFRTASLERTSREAHSGDDDGFAFTALYRAKDWINLRATYDQAKRTAEGETLFGFQSDEAERETKRTGVDVELTLPKGLELGLAYFRRDVEYPNRPDRIAQSGGVPLAGAQPIPGTPSGLLEAKYDSFTAEIAYLPSEKVELGAYYTYEKDATTNQWSTTTGVNLNNSLNYAGTDETDTFGLNASFQLKPDVCRLSVNAMRQKVDGLMDITAREAGSFYTPGRTTLIPAGQGGAADIDDWDDTTLTSVSAQLDYVVAKDWTLSAGYWYEKYEFKDAYTAGSELMPQAVLIFLKSNRGDYDASVVYAKVSYRF
ncbi:MAG: MtrB/PioB family outer membrane beta-barrel protein [Vicinamibacteria bacterium]